MRAKIEVMLNRGTREKPELDAPVALSVDNLELYGTWRVRPAIARIGGSNRIVIMDKDIFDVAQTEPLTIAKLRVAATTEV